MNVNNFINGYYAEIEKINKYHLEQIEKYKLEYPRIDYFRLYNFIQSTTNFLLDLDPKLFTPLASKVYNDINTLYDYYVKFDKKSKYSSRVYYGEFLENIEEYKNLKKEYDVLKNSISKLNTIIQLQEEKLEKDEVSSAEKKVIKRKYVDAIYELSLNRDNFKEIQTKLDEIENQHKLEFFDKFENSRKLNLLKLKKIISLKIYYYETLLWHLSKNSETINDFFMKSGIEGEYSTKLFIKYFLKNIDIDKSQNNEWFNYLKDILRSFE